ncbi:hypothetical protein [Streptomyces sp. NBC_01264]|uniref:hypothetical protein n=1 Tax=Streptomyces sp. NBC_01264 TaxID=2903804 RepID=UPI00224E8245|nr:hypothetical protein [Streptomyces sp. NBC_01264]MCX4781455.1 hypothetical protein [Streptomyces sp. NBC_01264]
MSEIDNDVDPRTAHPSDPHPSDPHLSSRHSPGRAPRGPRPVRLVLVPRLAARGDPGSRDHLALPPAVDP